MSYSDGEALILTRVRACSNFSSTNTSRGDWSILGSGKSDHYAILRPGPFAIEWITPKVNTAHYVTVIELWQMNQTPGTSLTDLYARAADLMAIQAYPRLADTTGRIEKNATVEGGEDPKEMWTKDGGAQWIRWELRVRWNEEVQVTYSD